MALCIFAIATVLPNAFAKANESEIPLELENALKRYQILKDDATFLVQAIDEDEPRIALNVNVNRNPASLIKLITTWSALNVLGPDFTWETNLYASTDTEGSILNGDILLQGTGDPFFLNEDLWSLLGKLKSLGVSKINGDLLIDDATFAVDETDPYLFDGDGRHIYNALPQALVLNFNSVNLKFLIDEKAKKIAMIVDPVMPNLDLVNKINLIQGPCIGDMPRVKLSSIKENQYLISGIMPASCKEYEISRDLISRDHYIKNMFSIYWNQWGGQFNGSVRPGMVSNKHKLLVSSKSRPLSDLVKITNKWSSNLMARMLVYAMAGSISEAPYTRSTGVEAILLDLKRNNLDITNLTIDNGSGLSRKTRLSAQFLFEFLKIAWLKPNMPEFVSSIPIAGLDGTAEKRFKSSDQIGTMHLKTGSLDNVSAIAGYIHKNGGKTFIVVCIINSPSVNKGIGKKFENVFFDWAAKTL